MNVTLDLSNGVSGDMVLGALLQMAEARYPEKDLIGPLCKAGSVMGRTEVEALTVLRAGGPAIEVRTSWGPIGKGPVTGKGMMSHLDDGLIAVSANDRISRKARSMLQRLLEAEMAVHNIRDSSQLHLHETGTPDTIVDIIGSCILIDLLELDGDWIRATPVSLGSGTVSTDHGTFYVPVPAVRHLLRGVPARAGPVKGELATPTGMTVILSMVEEWVDPIGPDENGTKVVGRGAGSRTYPDLPNVLSIMEGPT